MLNSHNKQTRGVQPMFNQCWFNVGPPSSCLLGRLQKYYKIWPHIPWSVIQANNHILITGIAVTYCAGGREAITAVPIVPLSQGVGITPQWQRKTSWRQNLWKVMQKQPSVLHVSCNLVFTAGQYLGHKSNSAAVRILFHSSGRRAADDQG